MAKQLKLYFEALDIINAKKVMTPSVKNKLIELGFKETKLGSKREHEIYSKEVKIDFHNYDIAIGLASRPAGRTCCHYYYAMTIKFDE